MWRTLLLFVLLPAALRAGPADVPVLFTNAPVTALGTSVFVVGSIPQLANWDPTHAIKMVASNCVGQTCQWSVPIGIPADTSYEYKFIQRRDDCGSCYTDSTNVAWEPGPNRTGNLPAGPPAPWPGKTVFYFSGWSSVSILYSNTATSNFVAQAMVSVSNGLWRADGLNQAGETNLVFLFTDNLGHYDNPDLIPNYNYTTPLDACVVRSGQVYNYWPPATVSTNRVEIFSINPTNGLASRQVRVYLPRGYNENLTKRYPVLYMHDGQNLFLNMGSFGSWHADTNANNLIRFGKMRETIIVGIDNTSDRLCEYTPPGCAWVNCGTPRGDKYASLLIDEVKPIIDGTYRTLPDAENTGVWGSSMGGLISSWIGWTRSDVFHRVGAMSSSYQICMPIPTPDTKRPIRIYLDSGSQDAPTSVGSNDGLLNTISERDNLIRNGYVFNLDLDHTIGFGDSHNEAAWDRRSPRCFTFLFPTSDEPNTVLDTAAPPRITNLQLAGPSNVVTWTSYRLRSYSVEGSTNTNFTTDMNWTNLVTMPLETKPWSYPSVGVADAFRFLRVREKVVPDWPN